MTAPNNWRPGLPVTNLRFSIPVGPSGSDPWWCWALYPVLAVTVWPLMLALDLCGCFEKRDG